jgi:hypothetical protein
MLAHVAATVLLIAVPGCGPKSGCDCVPDQEPTGWGQAPEQPTCGETLCPTIVARGTDSFGSPAFELDSPEALECALQALRDRTPGLISYDWDHGSGIFTDSGHILIDAEGTAVFRSWGNNDLSYDVEDAVLRELKPAEFYAQCLDDPSAEARLECVLSSGPAVETCADGWRIVDQGV